MIPQIKKWAFAVKRDIKVLYLAGRDPRVPWYAKALAVALATYALSPIDLIPDFIPILGYLDDLILLPLGIYLVIQLIPNDVITDLRQRAQASNPRQNSPVAAILIVSLWILLLGYAGWWLYTLLWAE